jgi:hypothetical protein
MLSGLCHAWDASRGSSPPATKARKAPVYVRPPGYCRPPRLMHSFGMQHRTIDCASSPANDITETNDILLLGGQDQAKRANPVPELRDWALRALLAANEQRALRCTSGTVAC